MLPPLTFLISRTKYEWSYLIHNYFKIQFIPKYNEWVESHKNINKEDLKYLRRSEDGLFYSIKSNKLYVPENLREAVMNYFHTSRYGGHHGINKTARKMYRWFYWPRLKFDLSRYIESCLACRRVGSPAVRYFRKVLEKAEPLQLVSMDFVGPREWMGEKLNYLVIIDHFSRFLVAVVVKDLTTETVMKSMNEFWLRYFGAPDVVLIDRGPAFISQRFKNFITGELTSYLIYSGSGYPQGNSINESAHKGLESSIIARKQYDTSTEFSVMLNDATLAYNSTPHSSTGYSPYYMLYGKEICLPGLQRFQEKLPEEIRRARIKDVRMQAMKRAIITSDLNMKIFATNDLKIGDQVVYKLTEYQQKAFMGEGEQIMKYTPEWSLPVVVQDVKVNTVDVKLDSGKLMNISRRLVRKIGTDLPKSLQGISTAIIEKEYPKIREQPEWIRDKKIVKRPRVLYVR